MMDVCINCHNKNWVDNFYVQYDALIELYNEKFAKPGLASCMNAGQAAACDPSKFGNQIDFIWFEIWHHEGRRARHGASMMGPDYTHWHGTYDVAKHVLHTITSPNSRKMVEKGLKSEDAEQSLERDQSTPGDNWIEAVLNSDDHKWFLGKMDPEEAARRKQAAAEEFKARYKK